MTRSTVPFPSWWNPDEQQILSSLSKNASMKAGSPPQLCHDAKHLGLQLPDHQESSTMQLTGQSCHKVDIMGRSNCQDQCVSSESDGDASCVKGIVEGQMKPVYFLNHPDIMIPSQISHHHSMARVPYPYTEPCFSGLVTNYGPQTFEKIRVALYVQKAAIQFIDAGSRAEYKLSEETTKAGFSIHPDELASIVRAHDIKGLKIHGGVEGIARKVSVSLNQGVSTVDLANRQKIYGFNHYTKKPSRTFLMFVWDAYQDLTLIILTVCAVVSIGIRPATEGWPKGMYDGLGIVLCILLVIMVTAISDYRQALQFKDLRYSYLIQVTRDGKRKKVCIYDLVVGDIVHLSIGDQVPADGIYVLGHSLLIDESSLSGESEPVNIYEEKPFLLSGTKVQDGSGKMLVTAVGMRTEWGKLMETLIEGGDDETPLQV